jgi:hypothetical protein
MINLLPSSYKEELRQEEDYRLTIILGFLFLIFLTSLILILFSIKIYIQVQAESLKTVLDLQEKNIQTPETQELTSKIVSDNQNLAKLASFYNSYTNSTDILAEIFQNVIDGIHLTSFSWQKDTSQVAFFGIAQNREVLFDFKQKLESQKEFTNFNFPTTNWVKASDIDFNVTFKINK